MVLKAFESDYNALIDIWDSAVSSTHDFLSKEDFLFYKSQLTLYFNYVDLYIYKDENSLIKGFLGVSSDKIEMLFIDNKYRKSGIGKTLLRFAIDTLNISKVDVNEDNKQAFGFYKKYGFTKIGYSEFDSEGKPYPIIFMELKL